MAKKEDVDKQAARADAAEAEVKRLSELLAQGGDDAADARIAELVEAVEVLESENRELKAQLEDFGQPVSADYEKCTHFRSTKNGRVFKATPTLRHMAKNRGLVPCEAPPVENKQEDDE